MVDVALHEHVGKCGDGHLQRGGDAHSHDLLQHIPMDAQLPQRQLHAAVIAHQHRDGQHSGHRLRDDGGVGHALHAHAEFQHEQQIQRRIHPGGHQQKIEGPPRVAHRPQNTGAHVVQQKPHDPGEVDGQINRLIRRHLRRRFHQLQHQRRHGDTHAGEYHTHDNGEQHGGVDGLVYLLRPVSAVVLADDHTGTAGHPQKKANKRVDDRRHRSHGGERFIADEVAYHPGVHHVV